MPLQLKAPVIVHHFTTDFRRPREEIIHWKGNNLLEIIERKSFTGKKNESCWLFLKLTMLSGKVANSIYICLSSFFLKLVLDTHFHSSDKW